MLQINGVNRETMWRYIEKMWTNQPNLRVYIHALALGLVQEGKSQRVHYLLFTAIPLNEFSRS